MSAADTLAVGQGSIGTRHVRLLQEFGRRVATVSRRGAGDFTALDLALERTAADYVVIANETAAHESTLHGLAAADFRGRVLVEKPLLAKSAALPAHRFAALFVGYNLRFHPILLRMKTLLAHESVLGAVAYGGQHLEACGPAAIIGRRFGENRVRRRRVARRPMSSTIRYGCSVHAAGHQPGCSAPARLASAARIAPPC